MSKFVDEILRLSKSSTTPIGFRHSVTEIKSPAMLLVARLSGAKLDEAKILSNVNASAGLIWDEGLNTKGIGEMVKALGNIPLGVFVKGTSEDKIDKLSSLGCDFMVFDISMPAFILQKEDVGKFLMIEPSLDLGFVKSINSLDVDGVYINNRSDNSFVDVERLLIYRRFVEIVKKPAIIDLPSSATKAELTVLWQAGIVGIVTSSRQPIDKLGELKKMLSQLPGKVKGRHPKANVKLPHYDGSVSEEEDEGQEEI